MSGRKNTIRSFPIISAGDMSSASLTSQVTSIQYLDNIGIQFTWTGSPVGTFQVQVSADYIRDDSTPGSSGYGQVSNTGNWIPLTLSYWNGVALVTGTTVPTSVGSPVYIDIDLMSAPWIRAVYTKSSGTGTLTAVITAKAIG